MPAIYSFEGSKNLKKFTYNGDYYEYLNSEDAQNDASYGLYVYNFMAKIISQYKNEKNDINKYINKYIALIESIIRNEKICYIKTYEKILSSNMDLNIEKIILCLLIISFFNENNTILEYITEHHKHLIINASILTDNSVIVDKVMELSIPITDDNMLFAITNKNAYCVNKFLKHKFYPKKEAIINAIIHRLPTETIIGLLQNTIEMNAEMLEIACKEMHLKVIDYLLDCGMEPTNKCLVNMFYAKYNRRIMEEGIKEGMKLLIDKGGYKMTNYDICFAIYCGIRLCTLDPNIKTTTKMLEIACLLNAKIVEIKHIVENGAIPNVQCLRNACRHNSYHIADYLITKFGIKPDGQCLMNMMKISGSVSLNKLGFAHFGIEGNKPFIDCTRFENDDQKNIVPTYNLDDPGLVEFITKTKIKTKTTKKKVISDDDELLENKNIITKTKKIVKKPVIVYEDGEDLSE